MGFSFFFFFFDIPHGMWDLSSWLGIKPISPAVEAWNLNHWTIREVPTSLFSDYKSYHFWSRKCGKARELKVKNLPAMQEECGSVSGSAMSDSLRPHVLEWVAISFSRGSSQPRDWTQVSCIAGRFYPSWATREAHKRLLFIIIFTYVDCFISQ